MKNPNKTPKAHMKEFTEFRAELSEETLVEHTGMPPNILILKRVSVRQFPGTMVALYRNERLGLSFSIPYGENTEPLISPTPLKEGRGNAAHTAKWMGDFEDHVNKINPQHAGKISWDDAHFHHSQGRTPEDAAKRYTSSHPTPFQSHFHREESLNEEHQVGDEVRYRLGAEGHLRVGKVVKVDPEHLVVHRGEKHSGKYGFHYKVPKGSIVHNSRTGYTREELNEISIPVATRAYHGRQQRGLDAMNKGDYSTALPHFKKALTTMRQRSKKYEREDKGDTVKEAVIQEDAISHLQRVRAFKTSTALNHKDGSQTKVDPQTANALLTVHAAMHPDNKKKFSDALEHSQGKFHKMASFSWAQVK